MLRAGEIEGKQSDCLLRLFPSSWLTFDITSAEEGETISLCPLPSLTHAVGQAFHSFTECRLLQVTITSNKSRFLLFPHSAAWSGDKPFDSAL